MFPFDDHSTGIGTRYAVCVVVCGSPRAACAVTHLCESWWCDLPGPNDTPTLFERPLCKGEGEVPPCVRRR